jgi:hypothetical protein
LGFSLLFALLLVVVSVIALEIAVPLYLGKWWSSINIVANPDHRMMREQYNDLNSDNIRSAVEPSDIKDSDLNVIMLGDSFVYGMWLGRQDTIPYRLEQIYHGAGYANAHVFNYGWISSSPYLSLRLLKEIGKKYKPDLVIEVVDMTDFWDDTFYRRAVERKGFFKIAHWFPVTSLILGRLGREVIRADWFTKTLWGIPWQRYFPMERPLSETRPYLDELTRNLDEMDRYVKDELHAPFVVFIMPRSVQYSERETPKDPLEEYSRLGPWSLEPFRYFAEVAPSKSYPIISLLDDFRNTTEFPLTMESDPHHTSLGNKVSARFIWQHLQQQGLVPASTTSR